MTELNSLQKKELEELYSNVISLRKLVIQMVDKYGYSASQLVSRTFEHDVELLYGRRMLEK